MSLLAACTLVKFEGCSVKTVRPIVGESRTLHDESSREIFWRTIFRHAHSSFGVGRYTCRAAGLPFDTNAILRPKSDTRKRLDSLMWHQAHPKPLGNYGQQQRSFHHCKSCSDANTWTTVEREIGKPRELRHRLSAPAVWIEAFRIREPPFVAMGHPWAHQNI
jgi:hypothetical protein